MWKRLLLTAAVLCGGCSGTNPASLMPDMPVLPPHPNEIATLVGAGDVGLCGASAPLATGRLLDNQPGTVFAAGDLAYPEGTAEQFRTCYDPAWGRHKERTRPAPGNHEYVTADAAPYFAYFGANAGPAGLGYYRYPAGNWQIYSLNSNLSGARASAELQWLHGETTAQPTDCSLAYFHHPRFSSGPHGAVEVAPVVRDLWVTLYNAGVDIVISGHEHFYERFAPQTPDGVADADRGIRQFVVGTGGASLAPVVRRVTNSEALLTTYGVLKLTLEPHSYKWEFLSSDNGSVVDAGAGPCH